LHMDVSKIDRVLHLSPRFLLPHLGVSSPCVALHPSQIAEGAQRGSAKGLCREPGAGGWDAPGGF
jgi:hypothetical protein